MEQSPNGTDDYWNVMWCCARTVNVQYIPRNVHMVFALLCFVVVIHWLIFPYPSGLLHWHWGNLTIAPVPAKQPWWIWINTSCEFIMNDCITTTKQSTTNPCAYFLEYTACIFVRVLGYTGLILGLRTANETLLYKLRSVQNTGTCYPGQGWFVRNLGWGR